MSCIMPATFYTRQPRKRRIQLHRLTRKPMHKFAGRSVATHSIRKSTRKAHLDRPARFRAARTRSGAAPRPRWAKHTSHRSRLHSSSGSTSSNAAPARPGRILPSSAPSWRPSHHVPSAQAHASCAPASSTVASSLLPSKPYERNKKQKRTFVFFPRTISCETLQPRLLNTTDNNATDAWLLGARSVRMCFHFAKVCRCLCGWECATTKYVALCE